MDSTLKVIAALLVAALSSSITFAQADAKSLPQPSAPTMKAIRIHAYGGVDQLKYEDVPRPVPAADEMLVRVHGAGVNPVDDKIRAGMVKGWLFITLPLIPGWDVSGTVEEVGKNIKAYKPGDAVFAYLSLQHSGGYAQYAIVRENEVAPKPKKLSLVDAAAVPLAGLTAWQALVDTAKIQSGQTVLIHGGSGGVGHFAVQIAKAKGCRVIATASAENQAMLKDLGADQAIDYRATKFEDVVKDVDVVLDTVGGDTQKRSIAVLKKGGILVSIVGLPDQGAAGTAGVRATAMLTHPDSNALAEMGALIDSGKIKPVISKRFPLADAAKAHEQIHTGHTKGKIVLTVVEEAGPKSGK